MTQRCYYCRVCHRIHSPVDLYKPLTEKQKRYEYPQIHKDRLFQIMKYEYENNICPAIKVHSQVEADLFAGVQASCPR